MDIGQQNLTDCVLDEDKDTCVLTYGVMGDSQM